jgi:hypothetical protein
VEDTTELDSRWDVDDVQNLNRSLWRPADLVSDPQTCGQNANVSFLRLLHDCVSRCLSMASFTPSGVKGDMNTKLSDKDAMDKIIAIINGPDYDEPGGLSIFDAYDEIRCIVEQTGRLIDEDT